ncbi:TRM1 [Candida pseudojiufengensis]|uniref:TRM1 n=1 Tax=Candida pseudojiufengensis TaxID=497109 RepID=UPI00222423B1|nr:TRM1 [Candida pseudojiufengensis]KAI5966864.1 TRM1 [Candida pseudojiufengensis]
MYKRLTDLAKRFKMSNIPELLNPTSTTTTPTPITDTTPTDNEEFTYTTEGKATILTPKKDEVFYNPIQQFNRDLSTLSIIAYDEIRKEQFSKLKNNNKRKKLSNLNILEALSATGLRSCRYGLEIPNVNKIIANDLSKDAVLAIDRNIKHNNLESIIKSNENDAIKFMGSTNMKFHIIDLDPYGTASPFIDSALQCIEDEGMLLVTCTDAAVLAGSGYPEKCFALYGGNNFGNSYINNETNHEIGIRLILNLVASTAAKYKKSIEPLMSLSIDYYFRCWIKIKTSPIKVKNHSNETMIVYGCNGCGNKKIQPLGFKKGENKFIYPKLVSSIISSNCEFCKSSFNIAGPMYSGFLQNENFINKILELNSQTSNKSIYKTNERIKGMLTLAKNELRDVPFYYNLNHLSSLFKTSPISIDEYTKAVGNLNDQKEEGAEEDKFRISLTHAKKNCIKSNIPWELNLKILKEWMVNVNKDYYNNMIKTHNIEHPENGDIQIKNNEKLTKKLNDLKNSNFQINPNLNENSTGFKILKYFDKKEKDEENELSQFNESNQSNSSNNSSSNQSNSNSQSNANKQYLKDLKIDFTTSNSLSENISKLRKVKMIRYQENPTKNWGPMSRPR